jgi:uncharacterized repeat protein (TIGR03803 family)
MMDSKLRAFGCSVAIAGALACPAAANPPSGVVARHEALANPAQVRRGRVISPDAVPFYRDYHDFSGTGSDGSGPTAELIADSNGLLYGTSESGGADQDGTIYRITLPTSMTGNATYKTLHSFKPPEGATPEGALLIGSDGGFYGMTNAGGTYGYGTVYRMDPTTFTIKTLHSFNPKAKTVEGYNPSGGLTVGPGGLLYGMTGFGGTFGGGTVFAISPKGASVSYATIHSFGGPGDGSGPYQGHLVASGSSLFGVTHSDENHGFGVAFELVQSGSTWSETVLHQFGSFGNEAFSPSNGLVLDKSGNLFGCAEGGQYGHGAVFELSPGGAGMFNYSIINSFGAHSGEPLAAQCALVLDSSGRLVGTSSNGGQYDAGTVFRLTPSGGAWTLSTRFSFGPTSGGSAYDPVAPLLPLPNGYFAGTAFMGGADKDGAMFEIKP